MRRFLRGLLILLAIFVVAAVAVRFLVPAEKWRRLALERFTAETGMEAEAAEASISLWPLGLRLGGVAVRDPKGGAQWERLELSADEVIARADLGSILRRKPRIHEIRLRQPSVEIWLPVEAVAPAPASGQEGGAAPASRSRAAVLSLLAIEDGRVVVHRDAVSTLELHGLDQSMGLQLDAEGRLGGTLRGALGELVLREGEVETRWPGPSLQATLDLDAGLQAGTVDVGELRWLDLELSGPLHYGREDDRLRLSAEFAAEAALPALREGLAGVMPLPAPYDEDLELEEGRLEGTLRLDGTVIPAEATPEDWLALLAGEGRLRGLRARLFGELGIRAEGAWALADGELRLTELDAALPGLTVAGSVDAPALGVGDLRGKLTLRLDAEPALGAMRSAWPRLPEAWRAERPGPESWPGLRGSARAELDLKLPLDVPLDPELTPLVAKLELGRLAIAHPMLADSVLVHGGRATATMLKADLYDVRASGPGFDGSFQGGLAGWPERLELTGVVRLTSLDVERLQASVVKEERAQRAWSLVDVAYATEEEGLPAPPENLQLALALHAETLRARGYELHEVAARAFLRERRLELTALQGRLGEGALSGGGHVDWTVEPPVWDLAGQARELPSGELFAPFAGKLAEAMQTAISGSWQLQGPVDVDPDALRRALSGEASLRSGDGRLRTETLLGNRLSAFLAKHAQHVREIDFRSLAGALKIEQGRVGFDELVLDGATGLTASGWVGLDGRCDYRIGVHLPPGITPDLGALEPVADLLRDEDRRIRFAVDVSGPATKPKVEIDFAELEDRAQRAGADAARRGLDRLLEDRLRGDPGDSTATDPAGQLEDKAKDALDGLLKGLGKKKKG